jgi:hypothetical protein
MEESAGKQQRLKDAIASSFEFKRLEGLVDATS